MANFNHTELFGANLDDVDLSNVNLAVANLTDTNNEAPERLSTSQKIIHKNSTRSNQSVITDPAILY
jgi:uncharacterized protein YjbI with pentapeptide repeats